MSEVDVMQSRQAGVENVICDLQGRVGNIGGVHIPV
jgi:hypothetical protein